MSNDGPSQWTLNGLDLVRGTGLGYRISTFADGWDLGSPEADVAVFSTLAADGDDERIERHSNRTVPFRVRIEADDSAAAQDAERALALALRPGELVWQSPDGRGAASVFEVAYATMQYVANDFDLVGGDGRKVRATYALSVRCAPFVRPVDPVTKTLTFSETVSLTTIKDGASTAGVTATQNAMPSAPLTLTTTTYLGDTAIKGTPATPRPLGQSAPKDYYTFTSVALPAGNAYLAVDCAVDSSLGVTDAFLMVGSAGFSPVASETLTSGYRRFFFALGLAGTTFDATVIVETTPTYTTASTTAATYVGGVYGSNTTPKSGLMVFAVEGSQRAPFSLRLGAVSDPGSTGTIIAFSDPAMLEYGYSPGTPATWANAPAGSYALVTGLGVVGQVYTATINGVTATSSVKNANDPLFFTFQLGARRDGRIGPVTTSYTINGTASTFPASAKLFRNDSDTSLTYLTGCGRYTFIDSPTIARPALGLWTGASADGSDATSALTVRSADPMTISPDVAAMYFSAFFTVGLEAVVAYYPRSHTFVPSAVVE